MPSHFGVFLADEEKVEKPKPKKRVAISDTKSPQKEAKDISKRTAKRRAIRNWQRAKAAVQRKVTKDMLGPQRRSVSMSSDLQ